MQDACVLNLEWQQDTHSVSNGIVDSKKGMTDIQHGMRETVIAPVGGQFVLQVPYCPAAEQTKG